MTRRRSLVLVVLGVEVGMRRVSILVVRNQTRHRFRRNHTSISLDGIPVLRRFEYAWKMFNVTFIFSTIVEEFGTT